MTAQDSPAPLTAAQTFRACPDDAFAFTLSSELSPLDPLSGHRRAREALDFGTAMRNAGFNLYVLGHAGHGKHHLVQRFLRQHAATQPAPPDLAYRYHFDDPARPLPLSLPTGQGRVLRADLDNLVDELRSAIPALFEGDEYQNRLHELKQAMAERQRDAIEAVRREAREHDILLLSTPNGFTFAPADAKGEMLAPEAFQQLPRDERERIEGSVAVLQKKLTAAIRHMPRLAKQLREQIHALNEEMLHSAIGAPLEELEARYPEPPGVRDHLAAIRQAILAHVDAFLDTESAITPEAIFSRCRLNLLVDNQASAGVPVVYLDLPTHQHLVGRIEHHVHNGTLLTDFSLIRPGALHRANGGYLILDAHALLTQPGAWDTLKRVLRAGEIRTESLEQAYGLISTTTLEPEPVPLDLKVVLLGERQLYYLLCEHDPDFHELFKVQADLEDTFPHSDDQRQRFARLLATLADEAGLRPLTRGGMAAMVERAGRLADDQQKLSARHRALSDLLQEADHWAGVAEATAIDRCHVERAVAQQHWRAGRLRELSHEQITRGSVAIATEGREIGQVNGLAVFSLGDQAFGQPTRITATARPGAGQVVDIERESRLGGRIHAKAVMILSRCLASRYAPETPLSLSASLAFEQSYGGIEGDSASVAEACALISAIARAPLDQRLAVTGSIDQHGRVQAVGGVNEKIEGFFAICRAQGALAGHGVLLPASNLEQLMLERAVREAVAAGQFRLYPIEHLDQALALLTGEPPACLHARVTARLADFHATMQRHAPDDASRAAADTTSSDPAPTDAPPPADDPEEDARHGR